jgi:homospermidine synthase
MEKVEYKNYGHIDDILLIGHGSIGRGVLPLMKRHFTFNNLMIVDPFPIVEPETEKNIHFYKIQFLKGNYIQELDKLFLNSGKIKFLVNLSVYVESKDLILYCQEKQILYIDTANYPWGED